MSSEQVIAVPEVFRERLAGGWSFAYQPGTNYVGLNHPQGGKQSVLRIEYGAYADEIGSALAAFLNLSTPANLVTVPASELRAMREEIERLRAIAEAVERAPFEYEFEVWQDDAMQAGGTTTTLESAIDEAAHYRMMYGQDGPVEVKVYERRAIPDAAIDRLLEIGEDG